MKTIDEQIYEWEPMIHYVVRHLNIHPNEQDDCVQIARIALWEAINRGCTLSKTYCFQRIRGAILNHQQKNARHLKHEVAAERIPEQCMTSERHLFDWLDEQRVKLSPRHFELLCHLIDGTEQTLDYSASRLRAYKADVQRELREDIYSKE
ncbi:sigma factor [Exiguobacterium aurantiacum]|uniref:sigma factor n=1 Tax=Exiguobacterium aurantiacum TaxID=33987 RepID=UPI0038500B0B